MKILVEVEPENVFERASLIQWIKNMVKAQMTKRFKIKKVSVEVLE